MKAADVCTSDVMNTWNRKRKAPSCEFPTLDVSFFLTEGVAVCSSNACFNYGFHHIRSECYGGQCTNTDTLCAQRPGFK